jgi:hypothetical protein
MSTTTATGMPSPDGPAQLNRNVSGIVQVYYMSSAHFNARIKDAYLVPMMRPHESLALLPPSLAVFESLTKAVWWLHLATWIPFVFYVWMNVMQYHSWGTALCTAVAWFIHWPLVEYLLHRSSCAPHPLPPSRLTLFLCTQICFSFISGVGNWEAAVGTRLCQRGPLPCSHCASCPPH